MNHFEPRHNIPLAKAGDDSYALEGPKSYRLLLLLLLHPPHVCGNYNPQPRHLAASLRDVYTSTPMVRVRTSPTRRVYRVR